MSTTPPPRSSLASVLSFLRVPRALRNNSTLTISRTPVEQQATLIGRLKEVFLCSWDLGFTAFGGPPVHFQILHRRFVEKHKWIDEQTYQILFGTCQSLPGPGSTQMGFAIALTRAGPIPAIFWFIIWSLPGALGMFAFGYGVGRLSSTTLPSLVFALLSGSNAATVGIIAAAAMQLSHLVIQDQVTRLIVIAAGSAGMCFSALWYFPMLITCGACTTIMWDLFGKQLTSQLKKRWDTRRGHAPEPEVEGGAEMVEMDTLTQRTENEVLHPSQTGSSAIFVPRVEHRLPLPSPIVVAAAPQQNAGKSIGFRTGAIIVVLFLIGFIVIVALRGALSAPPVLFKLFANMFLAGTIIFGGGPVVIPLLKEYVVNEGWVSSRDFLIGVALIQAFPGPNFNFAVYLGALTSHSARAPSYVTALLGFLGIFLPGLILVVGVSPLWVKLGRYRTVRSGLRGLNAAAVGLVWTAVYRLWEIGYLRNNQLSPNASNGVSLGLDPWWVVVGVVSFSANRWFRVNAAVSILCGVVMGAAWWGVVRPE